MFLQDNLMELISRFKETLYFKEKTLRSFCKYGVQVEGWLKGEFLSFLDNEKSEGRIPHFDREVLTGEGRRKADYKIGLPTSSNTLEVWIELKHWLIGYQKGTKYNAQFYFGDSSSVGIKPDAEKLTKIPNDDKFILILTTANPSVKEWSRGVTKFNGKFSPLYLKSLTTPADFPSYYFLGLLEVKNL